MAANPSRQRSFDENTTSNPQGDLFSANDNRPSANDNSPQKAINEKELLKALRNTQAYQEQVGGADKGEQESLLREISRIEGELSAMRAAQQRESELIKKMRDAKLYQDQYGGSNSKEAAILNNELKQMESELASLPYRTQPGKDYRGMAKEMAKTASIAAASATWKGTKNTAQWGWDKGVDIAAGTGRAAKNIAVGSTMIDTNELKSSAINMTGNIFIFSVVLISILDILPIFGAPYSGLTDPLGFLFRSINDSNFTDAVTAVLVSYLVLRFFLSAGLKKSVRPIPLILFVMFTTTMLSFGGKYFLTFSIQDAPLYMGSFLLWGSILAFFGVVFWDFRVRPEDLLQDILYFFYAASWAVTTIFAYGWLMSADYKPLIHWLFLVIFVNAYLSKAEQDENLFHIFGAAFIFLDFFGTYLLYNQIALLKFIPLLLLGVSYYVYIKERSKFAMTILVLAFLVSFGFGASQAYASQGTTPDKATGLDAKTLAKSWTTLFTDFIKSRIETATQFSGQVEQNKYESLGVYFSSLKAAQPRFYSTEPVIIWGTLRSKSYQDMVAVTFKCRHNKDGLLFGTSGIPGIASPKDTFPIFQLEQTDIECRFPPGTFTTEGSNTITLSAEYNFTTSAYQKSYFMDLDRYRTYTAEGARDDAEIIQRFGLKDPNPSTVFTKGPVEIGMQVPVLNRVYQGDSPSLQRLYITLTNRQEIQDKDKKIISRWDGKIRNIQELILLLPPGVDLVNPEDTKNGCGPLPFRPYTKADCLTGCEKVPDACKNYCPKNNQDCQKACEATKTKCEDDCKILFNSDSPDSEEYKGYSLDTTEAQKYDPAKDIGRYLTFSCPFKADRKVLDNSPITIRYFRVKAKYHYLLENTVQINIEKAQTALPDQKTTQAQIETVKNAIEASPAQGATYPAPRIDTTDEKFKRIMAVAWVESKHTHCCAEQRRVSASTCKKVDTVDCPKERTLSNGISVGFMQIYPKYHQQNVVKVCGTGGSLYNRDCNIKMGESILSDYYRIYGGMDIEKWKEKVNRFCKDPTLQARYHRYTEWDRALRAYNGLGCAKNADVNYVEKVNAVMAKYTPEGLSTTETANTMREGEGMVPVVEKDQPDAVQNLQAIFSSTTLGTASGGSVKITFTPSQSPYIIKYYVKRMEDSSPDPQTRIDACTVQMTDANLNTNSLDCADPLPLVPGKSYSYVVVAESDINIYPSSPYSEYSPYSNPITIPASQVSFP